MCDLPLAQPVFEECFMNLSEKEILDLFEKMMVRTEIWGRGLGAGIWPHINSIISESSIQMVLGVFKSKQMGCKFVSMFIPLKY